MKRWIGIVALSGCVREAGCTHVAIATGGGVPEHPIFRWVNTMLGNVKNALHGTYHALRRNYLQRHLSEFCYRFKRRYDLEALVARMVVAAARTPPRSSQPCTRPSPSTG
ncbi:MAG: transposase [Rhodanobacteraceae bacterium]